MTRGRVIAWSALAVLPTVLFASSSISHAADSQKSLQPVKRTPAADPFVTAQVQIARLRQTADQLRLLANRPMPVNATGDLRQEYRKHEEWLRQAEHRVNVLANEWEQRMKPRTGAQAADLNTFFELQTTTLQSKLNRESLALEVQSDAVRSARDTARLVIGKMN